jgi:hypothetical protein
MGTRFRPAAVGLGAAVLTALGCGGSDGPATYPVRGKVVYKGAGDVAKLAGGQVHFESAAGPRVTASGEIAADGTFAVWCHLDGKDREGVPAGEYKVCVRPPKDDDTPRRGPLHPRYQTFDKSGLKATVTAGTNTPTFEVEAHR